MNSHIVEIYFGKSSKNILPVEKKYHLCHAVAVDGNTKPKQMNKIAINPEFVSDNNTFKFVHVPSMYYGFFDVMYKGQRIAIINGVSAPLQWTAKNGSNIPVNVITQLEKMVVRLIKKSHK